MKSQHPSEVEIVVKRVPGTSLACMRVCRRLFFGVLGSGLVHGGWGTWKITHLAADYWDESAGANLARVQRLYTVIN